MRHVSKRPSKKIKATPREKKREFTVVVDAPTQIDAKQMEPKPSAAEAKLKANMEAMVEGQGPQAQAVIVLTKVEDLTLRSTYLQAKLLEQQYLTARSDYMIAFDRRADVADMLRKVEAANNAFNKALADTHNEHGTSTSDYVYDMERRALVPRSGVSETPVVFEKEPHDEEKIDGDSTEGKKEDKSDKPKSDGS